MTLPAERHADCADRCYLISDGTECEGFCVKKKLTEAPAPASEMPLCARCGELLASKPYRPAPAAGEAEQLLGGYADSYERMRAESSEATVSPGSVAFDIRKNMIQAIERALAARDARVAELIKEAAKEHNADFQRAERAEARVAELETNRHDAKLREEGYVNAQIAMENELRETKGPEFTKRIDKVTATFRKRAERAESEVERLRKDLEQQTGLVRLADEAIKELRKDAERYRAIVEQTSAQIWMHGAYKFVLPLWLTGTTEVNLLKGSVAEHLDNHFDAAIKEASK